MWTSYDVIELILSDQRIEKVVIQKFSKVEWVCSLTYENVIWGFEMIGWLISKKLTIRLIDPSKIFLDRLFNP